MTDPVPSEKCERLYGGSIKICICRLAGPDGGWLECPEEARGILGPDPAANPAAAVPAPAPVANAALRSEVHAINASLKSAPVPGGKEMGFTGSICPNCGGVRMVRNGVCETCLDCFHSGECG